jgi:hypothetical protein
LLVVDELPWHGPLCVEMKLGLLYRIAGVPKLLEVQRLIGDASDCKIPALADGGALVTKSLILSTMSLVVHLFSGSACSGTRVDSDRGVKKGDWFAETNAEDEVERFLDAAETRASASEVSC